jgi:hypothetical protein
VRDNFFQPLPLSAAHLERYRTRTKPQRQAALTGGHLMRRKGQSLEFHDYRSYFPGDDVRHIDWRASARHGGVRDFRNLLVKNFTAEEQMTLVISIDNRESMFLPRGMPKLLIAAWLAEAVSRIALRSGDRVVLHPLFGKNNRGIHVLQGSGGLSRVSEILQRLIETNVSMETMNLDILDRYLPPTAVWLIVTDFYFDMGPEARKLANRLIKAQDGWRWIISLDLDSWPYEKTYLGTGARKIEGPRVPDPDRQYEITPEAVREIESRINHHKEDFHRLVSSEAYDRIRWEWSETEPDPGNFFQHRFGEDRVIQRLFMKGKS